MGWSTATSGPPAAAGSSWSGQRAQPAGHFLALGSKGSRPPPAAGGGRDRLLGELLVQDRLQVVGQGLAGEQEGLHPLEHVGHHHVEQHAGGQGEEQEHRRDHHRRDLVGGGLLGIGGHAHAREQLGDEQRGAEGPHQDGDVPVDCPIGVEAHLAQGLDEQEAAAGRQPGDPGLHGGIAGRQGGDASLLIHTSPRSRPSSPPSWG